MRKAIDRYILAKRAENAAPNTIRAYHADLIDLSNFMGPSQTPDRLSREIVRGFLSLLHRNGITKTTAVRKLAAIKSFSEWLRNEEVLDDDTYQKIALIKRPRLPDTLPDVPSQEQMRILLDGEFPTAFPERDKLILELLYGSGLRVSEAANIKMKDLRPEQRGILIKGKGGMCGLAAKERLVPLNPHSQSALDVYLAKRSKFIKGARTKSDALFFAVRNRYAGHKLPAINVRSVSRMLLGMTKIRGLQPMHPHLLRHACETHMLDNGCPLDVIAEILGHDNLDVTAHYAQVSTRLIMEAYNSAHPYASCRRNGIRQSESLSVPNPFDAVTPDRQPGERD
jgi:integrase/recombinase XerC